MLEVGSLVDGKYKILNKVGQGGMSIVYLAMNERANRQWAIKEVRKDGIKDFEVVKQGLIVETEMLKKLNHPGLPGIIDVIDNENTFLIVMDYIQGHPLDKVLEECGAQPQNDVLEWAKQLCNVLGYLHAQTPAIIYRDMKPANIMLKPDGNITLIDFGTAREFKEKNLADTTCLGTVGYAAPEQFGGMGQTDARTDIYCLGATIYHLITGRNPCESPYEIRPIREINPDLSSGLEKIILKCTQRNPKDRYQSCEELMYALEHCHELDEIYRRKQRGKKIRFIVSMLLTMISGIASGWGYVQSENKKSENYDKILRMATDYRDYYEAILTDPTRTEAYLQLNQYLTRDFVLSQEEGNRLWKLRTGLERKDTGGYSKQVDVLEKLRTENPKGYEEVCYRIGESFLFYYDAKIERDRYASAAKWLKEAEMKNEVAEIFCDISECLNLIEQYNGAKIKQTGKMYEEYQNLWHKVVELEEKVGEAKSIDSKMQVWKEITNMVNTQTMQFLEVTSAADIMQMLVHIYDKTENVQESVLQEDVRRLQLSVKEAMKKIEAAGDKEKGI